jgi:hypothetical protein
MTYAGYSNRGSKTLTFTSVTEKSLMSPFLENFLNTKRLGLHPSFLGFWEAW